MLRACPASSVTRSMNSKNSKTVSSQVSSDEGLFYGAPYATLIERLHRVPVLRIMGIQGRNDHIMLTPVEARDLTTGDYLPTGVVTDITTGPTGMLDIEVSAYPGSIITNTLTLRPVDVVYITD